MADLPISRAAAAAASAAVTRTTARSGQKIFLPQRDRHVGNGDQREAGEVDRNPFMAYSVDKLVGSLNAPVYGCLRCLKERSPSLRFGLTK
jgi:hypothetical protein